MIACPLARQKTYWNLRGRNLFKFYKIVHVKKLVMKHLHCMLSKGRKVFLTKKAIKQIKAIAFLSIWIYLSLNFVRKGDNGSLLIIIFAIEIAWCFMIHMIMIVTMRFLDKAINTLSGPQSLLIDISLGNAMNNRKVALVKDNL